MKMVSFELTHARSPGFSQQHRKSERVMHNPAEILNWIKSRTEGLQPQRHSQPGHRGVSGRRHCPVHGLSEE
jgi:hypothetical protein